MSEVALRILILFASAVVAGGFVLAFPRLLRPHIKLLLAFSGAFLLGVAVLHILPEAYELNGSKVGLFIIAGFLLQILLEYFSGGIEHGHIHGNHQAHQHHQAISITMLLSLCLHALTESMPLGFHAQHDHFHVGHASEGYLWAIVVHKVPITIALVSLMVGMGMPRTKTILYLLIFAIAAPMGILINPIVSKISDPSMIFSAIMGLSAGIILHVSTTILLETSENHRFNLYKLSVISIGFALALLSV